MFISEVGEANYYGIDKIGWDMVNQSNERFVSIISKYLNEPNEILYQQLLFEYEFLAKTNPIAKFNIERIYLIYSGNIKNTINVVTI